MQDDKNIQKATEVGIGMSGGVRVYSTTMPPGYEDLEEGVKNLNYKAGHEAMRVISWDDYKRSK